MMTVPAQPSPAHAFNPPPGWPEPPAGWVPLPQWTPPADWPEPPAGWVFWTASINNGYGPSAAPATGLLPTQPLNAQGSVSPQGAATPAPPNGAPSQVLLWVLVAVPVVVSSLTAVGFLPLLFGFQIFALTSAVIVVVDRVQVGRRLGRLTHKQLEPAWIWGLAVTFLSIIAIPVYLWKRTRLTLSTQLPVWCWLASAAAAVLAFQLLSGVGGVLIDGKRVESAIESDIFDRLVPISGGYASVNIRCPENPRVKVGETFICDVYDGNTPSGQMAVLVTSSSGDIQWDLSAIVR